MWSNKRTAGTQLGWAGLPAVLFLFGSLALALGWPNSATAEEGSGRSSAQRAAVAVGPALQVEFFAERGNAYTVEALGEGGDRTAVFGPVYGRGSVVKGFIRAAGGSGGYELKVESISEMGLAPANLIDHAYALNYGSRVTGLKFTGASTGMATSQAGVEREFTYSYEKTEPDRGELLIEFAGGGSEAIVLEFARGRIGGFTSTISRAAGAGGAARRASGTFRSGGDVSAAQTNTLEGMRFVFRDRGMTSTINFTTDFSGSLSRQGGDTEVISYTYDISSWPEASLTVAVADSDETHEFDLNFTARNSGLFTRRVLKGGQVRDTDRGKFSGKGADDEDDDGKGGKTADEDDCIAPGALTGRTLQANVGGAVVTLVLSGANTGSILKRRPNGRVTLQPFTYSYSREECAEGLLNITLHTGHGDEVHVFELDFKSESGGTCVRKRYEAGELDDTGSGSFSLSEDDGEGLADNNVNHHD